MKTKILIVEDEAFFALDLKRRLEQAGYTVPIVADNATDALAQGESLRPDPVLMDIRLKGPQDGIETADKIHLRFHSPVMFVTSYADHMTLDRAKVTEPFGYIVKPFHSVDFRALIEMALWMYKMEQNLRLSEAWLSATVRDVAEALIASDSDGSVAFMNATASQLTGWECEEARREPLLEVFHVLDENTHRPIVHPLETIYGGQEVTPTEHIFKLRKRDGVYSALVEVRLSKGINMQSRKVGIGETVRSMADATRVLILFSSPDARFTVVNKARLEFRDRSLEQEMDEGWVEGVHSDDQQLCIESYRSAFDDRRSFEMECRLQRKDGVFRRVIDKGSPWSNQDKSFRGASGNC